MKPDQTPAAHAAVEKIFHSYNETISALAFALRDLLLSYLKSITELPDGTANIVGYGYGPGYKPALKNLLDDALKAYRKRKDAN